MPVSIIIVSIILMAIFIAVAIAGNRAQDRQKAEIARKREEREKNRENAGPRDGSE